jgi:hypothetical protein
MKFLRQIYSIIANTLTVKGNINIQAGQNASIGTIDNYALSLKTNNVNRVFITNDGNVGIGTTAPVALLDLKGLLQINPFTGSSGETRADIHVITQDNTKSALFTLFRNTNTTGERSFVMWKGDGTATIVNKISVSADSFITGGNVGIGTTAPAQKLDIAGATLNRAGNLRRYTGYYIDPKQVANGTYGGYLLLAKAYPGSGYVENSEVQGRFTFSRGSTSTGNRTSVIEVHSKSAYDREYLIVNSFEFGGYVIKPVKVSYQGIVYHAIKLPSVGGGPLNGICFDGIAVNAPLIVVQDNEIDSGSEVDFGIIGVFQKGDTGNVGIGTITPIAKLHVNGDFKLDGSFNTNVITITSNKNLDSTHFIVLANASNNSITITLPDATTCTGRWYIIKKIDNSTNEVTITPQSGQTIDGQSSITITTQNDLRRIISNGINWYII